MRLSSRLLPSPLLSLAIAALWLALAGSVGLGHVILGAAIGVAIPRLTDRFWPDRPRLVRPATAARLAIRVVGDIVAANFEVAARVLGPVAKLRPGFVDVPLDMRDPFVATILGSIVSLTPGTVSIDVDMDRRVLSVHALQVTDPAALAAEIKARYEAPLKEIFGC